MCEAFDYVRAYQDQSSLYAIKSTNLVLLVGVVV